MEKFIVIKTKIIKKTMYKKKCQRCGKEMILDKFFLKKKYCSVECSINKKYFTNRNNEIIKKFQVGAKQIHLAREYKISPTTISYIIRKYGRKARKQNIKDIFDKIALTLKQE